MRSLISIAAAAVVALPFASAAPNAQKLDPSVFNPEEVIDTDVVIIGGGGAGTYSAIQLKDAGKRVVVVESKDRLGGHTETYHDENGIPIDIGVKLYHDEPIIHQWFARFNLTLRPFNIQPPNPQNVDLRTGQVFPNLPAPNQAEVGAALQRYAAFLAQYPQLANGIFIPEPVPEDLLLPFGQFAQKYKITAAINIIYSLTSAFGDVLEIPTVQVARTMSLPLVQTINNFLTSSVFDNSLLFERATAELQASNSLLLSSRVIKTARVSKIDGRVRVLAQTPYGRRLIQAKKILIAIPPTPENLAPLDASGDELKIFSQLKGIGYHTFIIRHAAARNVSVNNVALDRPAAIPPMPAIFNIAPTANPELFQVFFGTKLGQYYTEEQAKQAVLADIKRYRQRNGIRGPEPEIVAYSNHSPFNLQVGADAIRAGFYKEMYALQGKRNTFWASATWAAHDSTTLFGYTLRTVLAPLLSWLA